MSSPTPPDTTPPTPPPQTLTNPTSNIHVTLTHSPLSIPTITNKVRTPAAGALVIFAGTTRATNHSRAVSSLSYTAYVPRALATMMEICAGIVERHGLLGIAVVHRLGEVAIGEESVVVAIAARHRGEAWRGGEECLEMVKRRVEVWKFERFVGEEGEWRRNDCEGGC